MEKAFHWKTYPHVIDHFRPISIKEVEDYKQAAKQLGLDIVKRTVYEGEVTLMNGITLKVKPDEVVLRFCGHKPFDITQITNAIAYLKEK